MINTLKIKNVFLILSATEEKGGIPEDNIPEINAQEHIILKGTDTHFS